MHHRATLVRPSATEDAHRFEGVFLPFENASRAGAELILCRQTGNLDDRTVWGKVAAQVYHATGSGQGAWPQGR